MENLDYERFVSEIEKQEVEQKNETGIIEDISIRDCKAFENYLYQN